MKKWLLLVPLVMLNVLLYVYRAHADGNVAYGPGPQISATGANYGWPSVIPSTPGAVLVNNGVSAFAWSNNVVTGLTTGTVTPIQLITLTSATITQISAMTPATVGQILWCGNCTAGFSGGTIVVSTAISPGGFALSTGTKVQ